MKILFNIRFIKFCGQIALVHHRHGGHRDTGFREFPILLPYRAGGIEHRQHELRGAQPVARALHADPLHRVLGVAQAGRVGQPQRHAAHEHRFLHNVARRAGHVRHNRPLTPGQQVHERRFSRVRAARNHRVHTLAQRAARVKRVQKRVQIAPGLAEHAAQLGFAHLRQILLRVIGPGGEMACRREQRFPHPADPPLERAVVARERGARRLFPARGDQPHHGLRLREAELPVEERPARELARLRRPGPRLTQGAQRAPQQVKPAVARKFRHVLPREARRPAVHNRNRLVNVLRVFHRNAGFRGKRRFVHTPVVRRVSLRGGKGVPVLRREHAAGDRVRLRAGNADQADPARRLRRGDRGNGVCHGAKPPCKTGRASPPAARSRRGKNARNRKKGPRRRPFSHFFTSMRP